MNTSSKPQIQPRRSRLRLAVLAIAAAVLLVVVAIVVAILLNANRPQAPATVYLSPAAAPVDDESRINVSGLGWRLANKSRSVW
ncbi:MAG: hypothetical protein R2844_21315 [Caldilineales bacterium]